MIPKKKPIRQCLGCREHKLKSELIRIVRRPESADESVPIVSLDFRGKASGRGAYICPNADCLKRVRKSGAISRLLGVSVPPELWDELEARIKNLQTNINLQIS